VGGSLRAQTPARGSRYIQCSPGLAECTNEEAVGQKKYAVLDLRAGFDIDTNWQAALSVNNVLDKRYYLSQDTPSNDVWYGEPRNFMIRIDASF
jgi:outer membrane receptor for ferric coprogen and ferric-rhodotorulic acid